MRSPVAKRGWRRKAAHRQLLDGLRLELAPGALPELLDVFDEAAATALAEPAAVFADAATFRSRVDVAVELHGALCRLRAECAWLADGAHPALFVARLVDDLLSDVFLSVLPPPSPTADALPPPADRCLQGQGQTPRVVLLERLCASGDPGVLAAVSCIRDEPAAARLVLAAWQRRVGDAHPATLAAAHALAVHDRRAGDFAAAAAALEGVVAARRRLLGALHPDTLCSMVEAAETHRQGGACAAAGVLLTEVVGARRRTLGDCHPETIAAVSRCDLPHSTCAFDMRIRHVRS